MHYKKAVLKVNMAEVNEVVCLWCEARQEPLTLPLAVPLLSSAQLSRVLLQHGRRCGDSTGKLSGHWRKDVSLVVFQL